MVLSWLRSLSQRTKSSRQTRRPQRGAGPFRPRIEQLEDRVVPATLTVTNTADSGMGSLRQALLDANSTAGDDTINFAAPVTGTINLASALPNLSSNIDLEGPGAAKLTVQRSFAAGTPDFGIFNANAGATVTLAGLTITNGTASSSNGGGIENDGTLTVMNATVRGNTAPTTGAGIANFGTATVINSTISGNSKAVYGGGIYNNLGSTLTVQESTISGNSVLNVGGGIANFGTATVSNSTISDNTAPNHGGGIFESASGTLHVQNTIVAGNTCTTGPDVDGTIVSMGHNLIGDGSGTSGVTATDLVGTAAHPVDPMLGPLQDNGGPTFTRALMVGSPAIDAGDNMGAPATDQRGQARIVVGDPGTHAVIDIGAFEVNPTANEQFVGQVYHDLLHHAVDAAGLAFWSGQLNQGGTPSDVVRGIERSAEYEGDVVQERYGLSLNRAADAAGKTFWMNFLSQGHTSQQLEAAFLSSQEYFDQRGGKSNSGFLDALYQDVFGQAADAAGKTFWTKVLGGGTGRDVVAEAFLSTLAGARAETMTLYREVLRHDADSAGQDFFAHALQQGLSSDEIIATLAASKEYRDTAGSNPNPDVYAPNISTAFPGGQTQIYGHTYGEWAAKWWQYAYSLPTDQGPFFDETGANFSNGQSGPVYFLAGVINDSGTVARTATVPAGKALFFPIVNFENDNLLPPQNPPLTVAQLRAGAKSSIDTSTDLLVEVDGKPLQDLASYREQSPVFDVTLPDNNVFQHFGATAPAGTYTPLVDDGYYIMLAPLSAGSHTIHYHGTVTAAKVTLDVTYQLKVV